jgi:hypothetical protein
MFADPLVTRKDNKRMAGAIRKDAPREDPWNEEGAGLGVKPALLEE